MDRLSGKMVQRNFTPQFTTFWFWNKCSSYSYITATYIQSQLWEVDGFFSGNLKFENISLESVQSCLSGIYVSITLCSILPYFSFLKEGSNHLTFVTLVLLSNFNILLLAMIIPKHHYNVCCFSQRHLWVLNIWIPKINF